MENNKDRVPLEYYSEIFSKLNPAEAATRSGIAFSSEDGAFKPVMLNHELLVKWPKFEVLPVDSETCPPSLYGVKGQILMLRYLNSGVHMPPSDKFLSYRELPWGSVYDRNFQGRCVKRLAFTFGAKPSDFSKAAECLGGTPLDKGDASYEVPFFPDLKVRVILWAGDDEFPPSSQFLFPDNIPSAFSAEDLAVVGEVIIGALKEESQARVISK